MQHTTFDFDVRLYDDDDMVTILLFKPNTPNGEAFLEACEQEFENEVHESVAFFVDGLNDMLAEHTKVARAKEVVAAERERKLEELRAKAKAAKAALNPEPTLTEQVRQNVKHNLLCDSVRAMLERAYPNDADSQLDVVEYVRDKITLSMPLTAASA